MKLKCNCGGILVQVPKYEEYLCDQCKVCVDGCTPEEVQETLKTLYLLDPPQCYFYVGEDIPDIEVRIVPIKFWDDYKDLSDFHYPESRDFRIAMATSSKLCDNTWGWPIHSNSIECIRMHMLNNGFKECKEFAKIMDKLYL